MIKKIFMTVLLLLFFLPYSWSQDITLNKPENNLECVTSKNLKFQWAGNDKYGFEIIIWDSTENSIFNTLCQSNIFELKKELDPGEYFWAVRFGNPDNNKFSDKFKFSVKESISENAEKFKKTGNTLVVPVEFSDITFVSEGTADYKKACDEKMTEMFNFYKKISWGASETETELSWDVAPIYKSGETRAHYGRDVKSDKQNIHGSNYIIDAGDFGTYKGGTSALKKEACEYLVNVKNVPMRKYRHIIYFVPGDGGNNSPNDQIWPASNSAWPGAIIKIPFTDIVTGTTCAGIMQSIKKNTGTICHEFGHQFGLPDLYPFLNSDKLKERDLGMAGLMASGSHYGIGMTGLSKKRSYLGKSKKKDWLKKDRVKKINNNGEYTIYSRDAEKSPNLLLISIKSTWDPDDYLVVEMFDNNGPDKNMPAYVTNNTGYYKAVAGIFIYHSDDDDVEKIHYLKSLPEANNWDKRFFLTGGIAEKEGIKIEVLNLSQDSGVWTADIKINYDEEKQKPKGFMNTVKGIGIFIKNKIGDLFAPENLEAK